VVTWRAPAAKVNATFEVKTAPHWNVKDPHMTLLVKGIIPGELELEYSSFGEVNTLLI